MSTVPAQDKSVFVEDMELRKYSVTVQFSPALMYHLALKYLIFSQQCHL